MRQAFGWDTVEVAVNPQQPLFEARYRQISQSDRGGWSDSETTSEAVVRYRELLDAVGYSGGSMLELGCGRGNIGLEFARDGWQVTGADFSPTAIEWAQSLAAEIRVAAEFVVADLKLPWPFPDETFDVVIDANCLHFFHGNDRRHFLSEARRVLAPGGVFLSSSIVNHPDPAGWEMLGYDPLTRTTYRNGVAMNYCIDRNDFVSEIEAAGFVVVGSELVKLDDELLWLAARPNLK